MQSSNLCVRCVRRINASRLYSYTFAAGTPASAVLGGGSGDANATWRLPADIKFNFNVYAFSSLYMSSTLAYLGTGATEISKCMWRHPTVHLCTRANKRQTHLQVAQSGVHV